MTLHYVFGDMFATQADVRVNTVNCCGVMGAGVALAFKKRHPKMFAAYCAKCARGEIVPGHLFVWRAGSTRIVNLPTKRHWRDTSRYEDIESGLRALRTYLLKRSGVSVTLPALGCGHGGLDWTRVSGMIEDVLLDVDADIYVFSPIDSRTVT